ncbi:flagellar hook-length control protein FliK [Methylorubrum thiocyanatum]|uniref:flagellar hook-length control protein FliK n=1 Tax=Methylorubrum thiocyanatum TaxID=47958 RepID=UPI0035C7A4CE
MVSRADLAEVFFRQTLRPAASASRGSGGTARFSLEAAERKPAAPPRPASRRDETASARSEAGRADRAQDARAQDARAEDARAEDAKSRAARTDRAANARSATSQESRAQAAPARSKPLPAGSVRPGTEAAAARTPGAAAKSAAEGPERPAGDGTEPAQKAAAEEEAAKEAGATMASEKDARETKETDSGSPDATAVADPSALLSPPVPTPAPTAAGAAIAGQGGPGEGEPVEAAGSTALGHAASTAATAAATGDAPVSAAAGAAGFEAALAGMQEAAASAAPPPADPAAALPPPGSGAPQGLHAAEAASQAASQAAGTAAAAPPPATPPIPLGAVPMTIGLRSLSGVNRFAIRLDPVELGRIDVSLDLDKEGGKARAHLVVDRPETLALLQRDASALQQALAQAGFDVGAEAGGGIDLSLRSETGSQQGNRDGESASRGRSDTGTGGRDDIAAPLDRLPLRHLRAVSGLDIRI